MSSLVKSYMTTANAVVFLFINETLNLKKVSGSKWIYSPIHIFRNATTHFLQ